MDPESLFVGVRGLQAPMGQGAHLTCFANFARRAECHRSLREFPLSRFRDSAGAPPTEMTASARALPAHDTFRRFALSCAQSTPGGPDGRPAPLDPPPCPG